mmetsp:Transcript_5306/g.6177  ORF Transcript_5306/g.6177 Transcript_5306/m.6177 type:complete len:81 (+) Transcript_5306:183-425(+)
MCPLRYIVLALSALVALGVLLWPYTTEEKKLNDIFTEEDEEKETYPETKAVDFLTGRYLYNKYKMYRTHQQQRTSTLKAE